MIYKMVRDPAHCSSLSLRQAPYILKYISDGRTRKEIVEKFDGDEQLVLTWIHRNYLSTVSAPNERYAFLRNFIDSATTIDYV